MNLSLIVLSLVMFACVQALITTDEEKEALTKKIIAAKDSCAAAHKVSDEDIIKLTKREFADLKENVQCFTKCSMEKLDSIKDNKIVAETVIDIKGFKYPEAKNVKETVEKCVELFPTVETCAQVFGAYKCFEE